MNDHIEKNVTKIQKDYWRQVVKFYLEVGNEEYNKMQI